MINVGMIGCGSISKSHSTTFEPLAHRMRFAGFADIDLERARTAAKLNPGAVAVSDYHDLFEHVDAVVIAVPHDLHHRMALDAMAAGKHVLLEKPLAITEAECRDLIAADTSPSPVLMLGYVLRHDPLWQRFGRYISEQSFGETFHVSIWTEQYTDTSRGAWMGQAARLGGGQLFSHGCHYIDLLLQWLGMPQSGVHLGTNRGTPWMEREGTSNVTLKYGNGTTAYHFGTWGARGSSLRYAAHAHTTEGMLELNYRDGTISLHRSVSGGDLPALAAVAAPGEKIDESDSVIIYRSQRQGKPMTEQMSAFLTAIEQNRPPEVTAADSLPSLQLIWRLYEAEERGVVADFSDL